MAFEMNTVAAGKPHRERIPLDKINPDVVAAIKEAYVFCQGSSDRLSIKFRDTAEAEDFLHEARSYAYQADPRLTVTGNTTKTGEARFTVVAWEKPDGGENAAEA